MPTAARKSAAAKPNEITVADDGTVAVGGVDTLDRVEPRDPRWAALSKPFSLDQIERLPRGLKKGDTVKYGCKPGTQASADGYHCGGYHVRSIHLSYVGHAGVTMRLNEVDPEWGWKPMGTDLNGLPLIQGGLWIELTVLGVTRIGFGDAPGKSGADAIKELIGDAIRNAAMRFGVATYLWSKSEEALAIQARGDAETETAADDAPVQQRTGSVHSDMSYQQEAPGTGPNAQLVATHLGAFWTDFNALDAEGQATVKAHWPEGFGTPESLTIEQIGAARKVVAKVAAMTPPPEVKAPEYAPATQEGDEPPF